MALHVRRSAALRCPGSSEPVDQVHRFVLAQALVFLWLVEGGDFREPWHGRGLALGRCRYTGSVGEEGILQHRWQRFSLGRLGFNKAALEALSCQVRQGVLGLAVQG